MLPFRIFELRTNGGLHFVEKARTLQDAGERVQELAELWRGESSFTMK